MPDLQHDAGAEAAGPAEAGGVAAGRRPSATPAPVPGLADVDLTPERIQLIGMRTATVKREALGGELRTVGVVAPNERGLAQITTRFAGWVQKLLVSETGERVRRGQVLATIYSPEVLRAEQEMLVARGWNAAARRRAPRRRTSTRRLHGRPRRQRPTPAGAARHLGARRSTRSCSPARPSRRSPSARRSTATSSRKNARGRRRGPAGHGAVRGRRPLARSG